jgi:hypothetical protein
MHHLTIGIAVLCIGERRIHAGNNLRQIKSRCRRGWVLPADHRRVSDSNAAAAAELRWKLDATRDQDRRIGERRLYLNRKLPERYEPHQHQVPSAEVKNSTQ